MSEQTNDPGFASKYHNRPNRLINKDGSFNSKRKGVFSGVRDIYQYLLTISWWKFIAYIIGTFFFINCLFAVAYLIIGIENLNGLEPTSGLNNFLNSFFFSVQTFTTVGYGVVNPSGITTNLVASFEAMTGLLSFALATGLLYGRFSKPSAKILFSKNAIITPYQGINGLMFRIVNQRSNVLMEMEARVLFTTVEKVDGEYKRQYYVLNLEINKIIFFPLSWTIVHPIDDESPLKGKTLEDLNRISGEVVILIKGFDETFSQVVHRRYSYQCSEILEGVKFKRAFHTNDYGDVYMNVNDIHETIPLD